MEERPGCLPPSSGRMSREKAGGVDDFIPRLEAQHQRMS
jgi:hypothetical protein